jgi:hypothetical protein
MAGRRPPGRPKGTPKTGGRKKGTPNKATVEAKAACSAIVDDPVYRSNLLERARAGLLPPGVETMLWHYAKGKPKETVQLQNPDGSPVQHTSTVNVIVEGVEPADGGDDTAA